MLLRLAILGAVGEDEEEGMIQGDDLRGVDDLIAEIALTRRVRQRHLVETLSAPARPLTALVRVGCRRRFMHPRGPTPFEAQGFLVVETCGCLLLLNHDDGCVCEHEIECRVYRVDADGREHYATRPLAKAKKVK